MNAKKFGQWRGVRSPSRQPVSGPTVFALALLYSTTVTPAFAQCTRNCGATPTHTSQPTRTPTPTPGPTQAPAPAPVPTATPAGCTSDTLCLEEGRFLITATWTKP